MVAKLRPRARQKPAAVSFSGLLDGELRARSACRVEQTADCIALLDELVVDPLRLVCLRDMDLDTPREMSDTR